MNEKLRKLIIIEGKRERGPIPQSPHLSSRSPWKPPLSFSFNYYNFSWFFLYFADFWKFRFFWKFEKMKIWKILALKPCPSCRSRLEHPEKQNQICTTKSDRLGDKRRFRPNPRGTTITIIIWQTYPDTHPIRAGVEKTLNWCWGKNIIPRFYLII